MKHVDPSLYFEKQDFFESMLLRIHYDRQAGTLEFILDDAQSRQSGMLAANERHFVRLHFKGVQNIQRENTLLKFVDPKVIDYSGNQGHCPSVESVKISADTAPVFRIGFGTFGTFAFGFADLYVQEKRGRAVRKNGGEWCYSDAETGAELEFFNPFN